MRALFRATLCAPCLIAQVCSSLVPTVSLQAWLHTHSFISRSNLENLTEGLYFHLQPSGAEFVSPMRIAR
jgi:hypothetical protein